MTADDSPAPALVRAADGSEAWRDVVRQQRWATPNHSDIYAIASDIVTTLHALEELAGVLHRQVEGYGNGRNLYDDTRQVDPEVRLAWAAGELTQARQAVVAAAESANRFWSEIGHIGVEDPS